MQWTVQKVVFSFPYTTRAHISMFKYAFSSINAKVELNKMNNKEAVVGIGKCDDKK
jgi:hypothetical protein